MTTAYLTINAEQLAKIEKIAREHAADYVTEFGEPITPETAGDWDSISLGECVCAIRPDDLGMDWSEFRIAYLEALYGPEYSGKIA